MATAEGSSAPTQADRRLRELWQRHAEDLSGDVDPGAHGSQAIDPDLFGIALVTTEGVLHEVGDTRVAFPLGDIGAVLDGPPGGTAAEARGTGGGTQRSLVDLEQVLGRGVDGDPGRIGDRSSQDGSGQGGSSHDGSGDALGGAPPAGVSAPSAAVMVTAVDLAMLAATLAADGRHPSTGEQVIAPDAVAAVLSAMTTGAMYGRGGEWMYRSGVPARSNRAGGLAVVLPGRAGVGVFSPAARRPGPQRQGHAGVRGAEPRPGARLADEAGADTGSAEATDVRDLRVVTGTAAAGLRVRNRAEQRRLDESASAVQVIETGPQLTFATAEGLAAIVAAVDDDVTHVLVDVANLRGIDRAAARLLHDVAGACWARGIVLAFCGAEGLALLEGHLPDGVELFTDRQTALDAVEARLLGSEAADRLDMADFDLCEGMDPDDVAALTEICRAQWFPAGALMCEPDRETADAYLIRRGTAEVLGRRGQQIAVHSRGTIVGEMALLTDRPRSAAVRAQTDLDCYTLTPSSLRTYMAQRPHGAAVFMRNLARTLADRLRAATRAPAR